MFNVKQMNSRTECASGERQRPQYWQAAVVSFDVTLLVACVGLGYSNLGCHGDDCGSFNKVIKHFQIGKENPNTASLHAVHLQYGLEPDVILWQLHWRLHQTCEVEKD